MNGLEIDLNSDLGEGFGPYSLGPDEDLLNLVTSANVACGYHAGDPSVMRRTVVQARDRGVAVGAHPGYPDLVGFGRREMSVAPREVEDMVAYQIGALEAIARTEGVGLAHVKVHGALYNQSSRDPAIAEAVARAVKAVDHRLVLVALYGSEAYRAGRRLGLHVAGEVFADRGYLAGGHLAPRGAPGGLITDAGVAAGRVLRMLTERRVTAVTGEDLEVIPDTVCVHGDSPGGLGMVVRLRESLTASGVTIGPLRRSG